MPAEPNLADSKLIIFDWDGTLFQSIELIQNSIVAAGVDVGETISPELARHIIGLGLKAAQQLLFSEARGADAGFLARFHRAYRDRYEAGEAQIQLYEGVFSLISELHARGKIIAVATAKSRAGIERSLEATRLKPYVSHSRTPEECRPKPDPQMLHEILNAAGLPPEAAVMVGDTTHDLLMAQNAGVPAIAITHGAHAGAELTGMNPLAVCADIAQLRALLCPQGC